MVYFTTDTCHKSGSLYPSKKCVCKCVNKCAGAIFNCVHCSLRREFWRILECLCMSSIALLICRFSVVLYSEGSGVMLSFQIECEIVCLVQAWMPCGWAWIYKCKDRNNCRSLKQKKNYHVSYIHFHQLTYISMN